MMMCSAVFYSSLGVKQTSLLQKIYDLFPSNEFKCEKLRSVANEKTALEVSIVIILLKSFSHLCALTQLSIQVISEPQENSL